MTPTGSGPTGREALDGETVWINSITVDDPDHRGHGHATRLLEAVLAHCHGVEAGLVRRRGVRRARGRPLSTGQVSRPRPC
ncbi:GNAT family N-acetyltransferase [Kitasatospora sp. NPDC089509]|uniref:GNAT family N-acetyltransferase n=1 Tax=Kitasatospora sp. NPDC089509 TaxID=3364079 RepID=UPI00382FE131